MLYELPSSASTLEGKGDRGSFEAVRRRRRAFPVFAAGGRHPVTRTLFTDALHSLKDKGEITVDKDHWVKLVPRGGDIQAEIVSLSERFGFARPKLGG